MATIIEDINTSYDNLLGVIGTPTSGTVIGDITKAKDGININSVETSLSTLKNDVMDKITKLTYLSDSSSDGSGDSSDGSGDSSEIYEIGDTGPAGGYIFYKADSVQTSTYKDSNGNDVTYTWQYLEAAPEDVSTSTVVFGYYRPSETNTTVQSNLDTSITASDHSTYNGNATVGQGRLNTSLLVNAMVSAAYSSESGTNTTDQYAAKLCADYSYGGYDDWFLPSIEELRYMYENLYSKSIGTWSDYYWSSTEYSGSYSRLYVFVSGYINRNAYRNLTYYVRAIRAF